MSFKHLTLAFCAASLFTGCVITDGETADNTNSNTQPNTETSLTDVGTTLGTTTDNPTGDGTDTSVGTTALTTTTDTSTTDAPTTAPTTDGTTDATTDATTDGTTTNTTGPFEPGCGWAVRGNYYACAPEGEPGLEDPDMIDPIACKGNLMADEPCSDMDGPVNSIGCCTPEGVLYFCDAGSIFEQDCNE
jgi:hypothetical protein